METTKGIQRSLNAAGFTDDKNQKLVVDGLWGAKTEQAFTKMAKASKVDRVGIPYGAKVVLTQST